MEAGKKRRLDSSNQAALAVLKEISITNPKGASLSLGEAHLLMVNRLQELVEAKDEQPFFSYLRACIRSFLFCHDGTMTILSCPSFLFLDFLMNWYSYPSGDMVDCVSAVRNSC